MDNSRYSSNGWDGRRSGRSSRNRRSKASFLSSRLNPDFDPVDIIRQENGVPNNNNESRCLNNDELDPKTMNFEELVKYLHPTFISNYLQKVLVYLRSEKTEICFPNLAPFKEVFLLKIAENNDYLRCIKLNHGTAKIARQILDVLHDYKDVYKWTFNFENGRIVKNVLVYKKIYYHTLQNSQPSNNFKSPFCTTSSASVPISLASSLEDLNLNRNNDNRQETIPSGLKIQTLNATLKFIKDDNELTLEYPEMPKPHAEFLYCLLNSPANHKNSNIGFGFKSLYSTLFETMEVYEKKYDFKVTLSKCFDVRMAQLRLQKIVKNDQQTNQSKEHNISLTTEGVDPTTLTEKEKKTVAAKRKLVHSLPEYFIKRCLLELLDFIKDDSRNSLDFTDLITPESRFLECVTGLARGKEFYQLFSEECVILLKRVARTYVRDTWRLQMDVGKVSKRTQLRTLTMYKIPMSRKRSARNSSMSERLDDTKNDSSCSLDSSATPKNRSESKERSSSKRSDTVKNDRDNNLAYPPDPVRPGLRSASKDRRNQPPISGGIAFQSAGAQVLDTTHVADKRADGRNRERGLPTRKRELIEAMSTPLESDRAERMMRLMGWEGGALGARGEGITEPLIPALHILPGAGLGHVKPTPRPPRTPQDFRRYFLQDLLTFLESEERETAISYTEPLSKREARFVKPAVNAFNDRKNIGLAREQEVKLVRLISDFMMKECDLRIDCSMSGDKRQVKLRKIIDTNMTPKSSRKRRKKSKFHDSEPTSSQMKERDDRFNAEEVPVLTTIMDLEKTCLSLKTAKALAYKMLFLQKIKEFLCIDEAEKEYIFDCLLNIKQRTYIQDVVTSINKREPRAKYSSQMENDLYRDIRKVAGDCYMSAEFDNEKCVLKKKYYKKRFTNSSLDLPPPKSRDVKNTVNYNNSINVHDDDSQTNIDNADDDVIILDDHDDDIILLCDSDVNDNTTELSLKATEPIENDSVEKTTVTFGKTTERTLDHDLDSEICDDTLAKDVSIDISNESLHLDLLEADTETKHTADLENDVKGLNRPVLDTNNDRNDLGTNGMCNLIPPDANKTEKNESLTGNCSKTSASKHSSGIKRSSPVVRKDLEINNNFNIIEDRNNATANAVVKLENSDDDDEVKNRATTVTSDSGMVADRHKDLSPSSSKRSRSDSEDSDKVSKKYKKIDNIVHVRITPKDPAEEMTVDTVLKLQSQISESIDNSFFLPLLQCHGIKNGGLFYSCHSEKSLVWLKNVLGNFVVRETDVFKEKTNKLKFRINYIDGIEKVLSRLELYNTGLNTNFWDVTDVQTDDGSEIVNVTVDDDSFKFISDANFSLFAGVDKALFSVVWE